jgi:putative mRNA 3-end processing factor
MHSALIELTPAGFYCPAGGFHIDPWRPVPRAVITHAHSDHARAGSERYLTSTAGEAVLRLRVGADADIRALPYGAEETLGDTRVTLFPAGHVLGSSQVRIEHRGRTTVVAGDYKTAADPQFVADPTCAPFEPVRCDEFISEATFALPIYRWPTPASQFAALNAWWRGNQAAGRTSVVFAYALGKAQRILAGVDATIGPIYVHGAVRRFLNAYEAAGVALPQVLPGTPAMRKAVRGCGLVVAPPSAAGSTWLRSFGRVSTAFASGWMTIRGTRRRRAADRGFVISDHADWDGLLHAVRASEAATIGVTHGTTAAFARWLSESGYDARVYPTRFGDREAEEDSADDPGDADNAVAS